MTRNVLNYYTLINLEIKTTFRKIPLILALDFCYYLPTHKYCQTTIISLEYFDFLPKIP